MSYGDDVLAVMKVRADYCWAWDEADAASFAELFAEDGVLELGDFGGTFNGRADIADRIAHLMKRPDPLPATIHTVSSPSIVVDGDRASGKWYATVYHQPRHGDGPVRWVGWYHDEYRRTADGWRFHRVELGSYWFAGY